jgi:hypothetical protein
MFHATMDSSPKPPRPWRIIAHEITHEPNPQKVLLLSAELNRALAQQGLLSNKDTGYEPTGWKRSA